MFQSGVWGSERATIESDIETLLLEHCFSQVWLVSINWLGCVVTKLLVTREWDYQDYILLSKCFVASAHTCETWAQLQFFLIVWTVKMWYFVEVKISWCSCDHVVRVKRGTLIVLLCWSQGASRQTIVCQGKMRKWSLKGPTPQS